MKSYHDIAGDGGSRVLDQVLELQGRIAARLAGVKHRLAIASGKGGVGKSTVTFHLARALRRQGRQVAILDADLNGPSQAHLAGLSGVPLPGADGAVLPRTTDGIGVFSTALLLESGHDLTFDSVAPDESHTWRATRERTLLLDVLAGTAWGELDVLLVDLPPGAERTQQFAELLGAGAAFVLVTTPSDLARDVVARSARTLDRMQARVLGQVENMSGYWCADCGAVKPLFTRTGRLDLPLLGSVPFDPALGEGTRKAFDEVAAALWSRLEGR
jgi:ATP-binding protein involved in chromosome partitioning